MYSFSVDVSNVVVDLSGEAWEILVCSTVVTRVVAVVASVDEIVVAVESSGIAQISGYMKNSETRLHGIHYH